MVKIQATCCSRCRSWVQRRTRKMVCAVRLEEEGGVIGRSYETRRKNKKEEERERTKGKRGEVYTMVVDGSRRQTWAATHRRQQPHRTLQVWGRVLPLSVSLPLSLCRLANFLHTLFFQRTPRTKKRKRKIIVGVVLHWCQASNF